MAWFNLVCWLWFALILAGSKEPGAPPRAASDLVLARVSAWSIDMRFEQLRSKEIDTVTV